MKTLAIHLLRCVDNLVAVCVLIPEVCCFSETACTRFFAHVRKSEKPHAYLPAKDVLYTVVKAHRNYVMPRNFSHVCKVD
jgi:hypothetical protein